MFLRFKRCTEIRRVEVGREVVVQGRVVARALLTVPGTEHKCVFFSLLTEAWKHGPRGRGRKMWVPDNRQERAEGFFVDDGSGRIWVGAREAALSVTGGTERFGPIDKKGQARYSCRMIGEGDIVKVRGVAADPKGAEPGDCLALRPFSKGYIEVLHKKAAAEKK